MVSGHALRTYFPPRSCRRRPSKGLALSWTKQQQDGRGLHYFVGLTWQKLLLVGSRHLHERDYVTKRGASASALPLRFSELWGEGRGGAGREGGERRRQSSVVLIENAHRHAPRGLLAGRASSALGPGHTISARGERVAGRRTTCLRWS